MEFSQGRGALSEKPSPTMNTEFVPLNLGAAVVQMEHRFVSLKLHAARLRKHGRTPYPNKMPSRQGRVE